MQILSHVVALGAVAVPDGAAVPEPADLARIDQDPVRCADAVAARWLTGTSLPAAPGGPVRR